MSPSTNSLRGRGRSEIRVIAEKVGSHLKRQITRLDFTAMTSISSSATHNRSDISVDQVHSVLIVYSFSPFLILHAVTTDHRAAHTTLLVYL
jgi:hypothetical protein